MTDKASRANTPVEGPFGGFPDGQGARGGSPAPEPSNNDVVYIAIVRSSAPLNGIEAKVQMEAFREAGVEPTVTPHVTAVPLSEATANHHEALKALGFVDWTANDHFPVVAPTLEQFDAAMKPVLDRLRDEAEALPPGPIAGLRHSPTEGGRNRG